MITNIMSVIVLLGLQLTNASSISNATSFSLRTNSDTKIDLKGNCNPSSCTNGNCCSQWGWCGNSVDHCGSGCQPAYGSCSSGGGGAIADWMTCVPSRDTCANPSARCCVATADLPSGKSTCRPSGSGCSSGGGGAIADWMTCVPSRDTCANPSARCCVATADLPSGKSTCRPSGSGCSSAPVTPPAAPPRSGGISFSQFSNALTSNGFPSPSTAQYNNFNNNYASKGGITSTREAAMFLAQIMHESGGLQFKAELACINTNCPNNYRLPGDNPNLFYFGRGYIQLTWSDNYRAASAFLFPNDPLRLVNNPGLVASDDSIAWNTAFWYWKFSVHVDPNVANGNFGSSTKAINGFLECSPCRAACPTRFNYYLKTLTAFGLSSAGSTNSGC